MKLTSLQENFWNGLVDEDAIASLPLLSYVHGTKDLDSAQRLNIYTQMFFWRQFEALADDFPLLKAVMGETLFTDMVAAYLRVYPSTHPSLSKLGQNLPRFLAEHTASGARIDLKDIAAFEWACAEVFLEKDAPSIDTTALQNLGEAFTQTRLMMGSFIRVVKLDCDVLSLWEAFQTTAQGPFNEPHARAHSLLVARKNFRVFWRVLSPNEATALELAVRQETLGTICATFVNEKDAIQSAFTALRSWVHDGLVTKLQT